MVSARSRFVNFEIHLANSRALGKVGYKFRNAVFGFQLADAGLGLVGAGIGAQAGGVRRRGLP